MIDSRFRSVIACLLVALLVATTIQPGLAAVIGTEQILAELGHDTAAIASFRGAGVVA